MDQKSLYGGLNLKIDLFLVMIFRTLNELVEGMPA